MPKTPKEPVSERRLAANRANAQKSTGPRTPEGKAASSRNAVRHGFRSATFAVVRLEELDEVANFKADAVFCYKPVNAEELAAVEQIARFRHQMIRAGRLEAGLFTDAMNEALDRYGNPIKPMDEKLIGATEIEICQAQNRNYCLAEGFRRMAKESNVWSLMLRYQAHAERMYRRAVEDFDRLKSRRDEMPNEPNVGAQPEEPEDFPPLKDLNPNCSSQPQPPAPQPENANNPAANVVYPVEAHSSGAAGEQTPNERHCNQRHAGGHRRRGAHEIVRQGRSRARNRFRSAYGRSFRPARAQRRG